MLTISLLLMVASLTSAQDEMIIRQRETSLANALKTGNGAMLLRITDSQLHVSVNWGTEVKSIHTDLHRQQWIEEISHLPIARYEAKMVDIHLLSRRDGSQAAVAHIDETISFAAPQGGTISTHLAVWDVWSKQAGSWMLLDRSYAPKIASETPRLTFP